MKSFYLFIISFAIAAVTLISFQLNIGNIFSCEQERFSGAMQSLDFWTAQRAYPNKSIPGDAYYKAYKYASEKLSKKSLNSPAWIEMGPQNMGGRTLAVSINPLNPNTIYAGSASGGLWRSYSGGIGAKAWSYIPTGFPVLSVGAIAINPSDTNVIYIGTGEVYGYQDAIGGLNIRTTRGSYGVGLLKSTDNGNTWVKSIDWSYNQTRGVQVIKLDPVNPAIIYAGTSEGIYKSTDAGASWNQIHTVLMTTDILINYQNTQLILAACGNLSSPDAGIYRSTNGGSTWVNITTNIPVFGGKILLAGYAASPDVCFASVGLGIEDGAGTQLLKSTDFGASWNLINSTDYATYQGWYSHFVVPHPVDPARLLCAGIDVYKSTDGGTTLTKKSNWGQWYMGVVPMGGPEGTAYYSHADHHAYAVNPLNPDVVYFGNDGGVFRTTDFGESFQGCNGGYQTTQFYKRFGVSKSDSSRMIGGLQDNATAVWEGSLAWRRVIGGDGCCAQVSPSSSDSMYASVQNLSLYRSNSKGVYWSPVPLASSNSAFNAPFLLSPSNPKIIYAGADKIYKSTNGGVNWLPANNNNIINGDPVLSIAVSYTNSDSVYITTAPYLHPAAIFSSSNGGANWVNITGSLPDRYPVDISVDPQNSSVVYIVFSGFGTSHLYRSTDGGNSWINIGQGLPDVPASAICIDPLNSSHLYFGNDLGVYYSTDYGNSWNDLNGGIIGAALVMDLNISPVDRTLVVATHGRGVYKIPLSPLESVSKDINSTPNGYALFQNYPNPFNGGTIIKFSISKSDVVSLILYDMTGREVKILVSGFLSAGQHQVSIGTKDFEKLPSGVYLYKLSASGYSSVKKMIFLK